MAIEQVVFHIPESIQKDLSDGKLVRYGGVIRNQDGRIVTHLKETFIPQVENQKVMKQKIIEFASKNKNAIIVGTSLIVVATVSGLIYVKVKNKKNEAIEVPVVLEQFNQTFIDYFDAIQNQELSPQVINNAIAIIKELEKNQENEKILITLQGDKSTEFIDVIKEYTYKLAEKNDYNLDENQIKDDDEFILLKNCMITQQQIFTNY